MFLGECLAFHASDVLFRAADELYSAVNGGQGGEEQQQSAGAEKGDEVKVTAEYVSSFMPIQSYFILMHV